MRTPLALALIATMANAACAEEMTSGGYQRSYQLVRHGEGPRPLLIVLHGESQDASAVRAVTGFDALATREQIAIAYPDATHNIWNDGRRPEETNGRGASARIDDVGFIKDLAAKLVQDGVADPSRIYLAGISSGGAMALKLACTSPQTFAATAVFLTSMPRSMMAGCKDSAPIPLMMLNGAADPLLAYQGNQPTDPRKAATIAIEDVFTFWQQKNQCGAATDVALPDIAPDDGTRIIRRQAACPAHTGLALYKVEGGGHRLPALVPTPVPSMIERLVGRQSRDADATALAWAFLSPFRR